MPIEIVDDPEVERWPAHPERFVVSFTLSGPRGSPEFENKLTHAATALGVESHLYSSTSLVLFGVRKGQEAAVHSAVMELLSEENARQAWEQEERERQRPEREAAAARAEAELK